MTEALDACAPQFGEAANADVRLSFAGSDELAAQIRQGVEAGRLRGGQHEAAGRAPRRGAARGKPVEFATNELVLAVPGGLGDRLGRGPARGGRDARDRREVGADRLLHARDAGPAAGRRRRRRSSPTCARTSPT